jgi:hypothetical protein
MALVLIYCYSRWSDAESTVNPNQDIQDTFAAEYPMLLNWPDRRPIGQLFVAEHSTY